MQSQCTTDTSKPKARAGYLVSVDPSTQSVSKIETSGFPPHFQLNAHGLTIHSNNILYVLSHSYHKGDERLFTFELSEEDGKVKAKFLKTWSFGQVHGNYNGIAVVNSTHFYVTQWIPFPDQVEGRDNSFFTTFQRMSKSIYTQSNPVRLCQVTSGESIDCTDVAFGYIPNGILYHRNQLFFADSIGRTVNVFDVRDDLKLTLVQKVPISHTLDNLCAVGNEVYVTGISKLVDYLLFGESVKNHPEKLHHVPGGFSRLENVKGKWSSSEVIMQDLISLPSSVAITGKTVTFTSIIDGAFVFCPLP
jgi:hypothetical protein